MTGIRLYNGFHVSSIGFSHKELKKPLQDASGHKITKKYAIVAIADGHGGEKYFRSNIGSKLAIDTAIKKLSEFCNNDEYCHILLERKDTVIQHLNAVIISEWQHRINEHFVKTKIKKNEKVLLKHLKINEENFESYFYGTTLLFGCITEAFAIVSQIGDGKCSILLDDDSVITPIQEDNKLCFGFTTSLCDFEAINNFRYKLIENTIKAIVLTTDGIVDSYSNQVYSDFILSVVKNHEKNPSHTEEELKQWLPSLSERGSRDDVSIAGIYRSK